MKLSKSILGNSYGRNSIFMKERVIIFGTAGTGRKIYKQIKNSCEVIYFSDNNSKLWGKDVDGIEIISPERILETDFDYIHIGSMVGLGAITEQLAEMGVPRYKMRNDIALVQVRSRILFLENVAKLAYERNVEGSVAEAGVYRGDYSKEINRVFPDRKLYLFDTFEGFSHSDIKEEKEKSDTVADYLKDTSEELVLRRMPYKNNCIVRKGFFPDTAKDIDETFAYVSCDMDLYKPTKEALRYFYPRMSVGGVLAIHDFFSDAYPNIKQAVYEYEKEIGLRLNMCPVGDDVSIAIIK